MEETQTILKCKKCGEDIQGYAFMGYCEKCFDKYENSKIEKLESYKPNVKEINNNKTIDNEVSDKFTLFVIITKALGYLLSVISFFVIMFATNGNILIGLLIGAIICIITLLLSLFLEGFAEVLQLLEDIKNK